MNVVRPNDVSDPDEVAVHVVAVEVVGRCCGVGVDQAENTFFDEDHEKSGFEVLLVVAKLVLNNHRPRDACTSSLTTLTTASIDQKIEERKSYFSYPNGRLNTIVNGSDATAHSYRTVTQRGRDSGAQLTLDARSAVSSSIARGKWMTPRANAFEMSARQQASTRLGAVDNRRINSGWFAHSEAAQRTDGHQRRHRPCNN